LKLLYLRDYFFKYTNRDNPKNMEAIRNYLKANGIPASRVTIYNDIDIRGIPCTSQSSTVPSTMPTMLRSRSLNPTKC
jgi:hypothetical protein